MGNIPIEVMIQDKLTGIKGSRDVPMLLAAIKGERLEEVRRLMTDGIWCNAVMTEAAVSCSREMLKMILSLEQNIPNGFGIGYIIAEISLRGLDTLQLLFKNLNQQGRFIEMRQVIYRSFQHSLYREDSKTSAALLQNKLLDAGDALEAASKHGDLGMIKALFDIHTPDKFSDAALNRAFHVAREGYWDKNAVPIMEALLERGADVNSKCEIWGSALQNAASANDDAAVVLFISKGANIETPRLFGGNHPIIAAVGSGSHITRLKESYHGI